MKYLIERLKSTNLWLLTRVDWITAPMFLIPNYRSHYFTRKVKEYK